VRKSDRAGPDNASSTSSKASFPAEPRQEARGDAIPKQRRTPALDENGLLEARAGYARLYSRSASEAERRREDGPMRAPISALHGHDVLASRLAGAEQLETFVKVVQ